MIYSDWHKAFDAVTQLMSVEAAALSLMQTISASEAGVGCPVDVTCGSEVSQSLLKTASGLARSDAMLRGSMAEIELSLQDAVSGNTELKFAITAALLCEVQRRTRQALTILKSVERFIDSAEAVAPENIDFPRTASTVREYLTGTLKSGTELAEYLVGDGAMAMLPSAEIGGRNRS